MPIQQEPDGSGTVGFLREIERRIKTNAQIRKRRSKGIVDIRVRVMPQALVATNVLISDKRFELDSIQLDGPFDLKHESGNTYSCEFPVPRGYARMVVQRTGDWVMISTPGQGWFISAIISKKERSTKTHS